MARTRRFWLKHGGRRNKVALGDPFFEEGAAPPDTAYRALSPQEEAESLARWKAAQLRERNRVAPTAGELSTVAIMAAALLALMRMERVSPLDGSRQDSERLAEVEGGSRVEQFVSPLFAELSTENDGLSGSPAAPGTNLADAGVGATILGPFRYLPGTAGTSGPLVEDRPEGVTVRAATAGYFAGTAAAEVVSAASAASRAVTDADAQRAAALPIEAGADGALTDAPATTERAWQAETERLVAIASSGDTAAPPPATPESVWTQLTLRWGHTAPSSPSDLPDQAGSTPSAPVEGPGNSLPASSQAPGRSEESAMPALLAAGPGQQAPQDAPDNSGSAPGLAEVLPPGRAKQEEGPGDSESPPVVANLLPPGLGKQEEGPSNSGNAPARSGLLPPGLAKRQEADAGAQEGGLLAALPPGLAKRQESDEDEDDDQLLAALSPGQQRQNERAAAQMEDDDHRGRGPLHDDVVFIPFNNERGGPEDVGPHAPVDPLLEPRIFAAVPAALDAIL